MTPSDRLLHHLRLWAPCTPAFLFAKAGGKNGAQQRALRHLVERGVVRATGKTNDRVLSLAEDGQGLWRITSGHMAAALDNGMDGLRTIMSEPVPRLMRGEWP